MPPEHVGFHGPSHLHASWPKTDATLFSLKIGLDAAEANLGSTAGLNAAEANLDSAPGLDAAEANLGSTAGLDAVLRWEAVGRQESPDPDLQKSSRQLEEGEG